MSRHLALVSAAFAAATASFTAEAGENLNGAEGFLWGYLLSVVLPAVMLIVGLSGVIRHFYGPRKAPSLVSPDEPSTPLEVPVRESGAAFLARMLLLWAVLVTLLVLAVSGPFGGMRSLLALGGALLVGEAMVQMIRRRA